MNISFNGQLLVSSGKTGLAYAEEYAIQALIKRYPQDTFTMEYFGAGAERRARSAKYKANNVNICECAFFNNYAYRFLSALVPLPYRWFFHTEPDVVHFFDFIIPPGTRGKKVVTIHDLAFKRHPETVRARSRYMLEWTLGNTIKRADRIVAVSEWTKQEILAYYKYPAEKISVVHNGVDTEIYNTKLSRADIDKVRGRYNLPVEYVLYLGTIEPRKNVERLIEAYTSVKLENRDFPVLVLAGKKGWLYERIIRAWQKSPVRDSILWTDYIQERDKPFLMAGAKFFCFPSLYEGFGMPVLEAFACGTPVLTSGTSSLKEVAGDAACFINPLSKFEIYDNMVRLYADEDLRARLRQKGLERVKHFSWLDSAVKLHGIYEDLYKEAENE